MKQEAPCCLRSWKASALTSRMSMSESSDGGDVGVAWDVRPWRLSSIARSSFGTWVVVSGGMRSRRFFQSIRGLHSCSQENPRTIGEE